MVGGLFCFLFFSSFFSPPLQYREEYESRILLVILYVTLNTVFDNKSRLLPPAEKKNVNIWLSVWRFGTQIWPKSRFSRGHLDTKREWPRPPLAESAETVRHYSFVTSAAAAPTVRQIESSICGSQCSEPNLPTCVWTQILEPSGTFRTFS